MSVVGIPLVFFTFIGYPFLTKKVFNKPLLKNIAN